MNAINNIFKCILSGLLFLSLSAVQAQEKPAWELGLGVGYTNYYGDLSPYQINGLKNLYRIADFNNYYQNRPSFSVMLHRKLTPTLGFMLQANYLQFSMSDRYRNKSGSLDTSAKNFARSLNFRTDMRDIGLAFTFNTNNGRVFAKDAFFYPSFYLGAGVSQFTVKGDLYDASNSRYDYRLPGIINDGSFETNLRDQHTELENRYDDVIPYVNLGLALNFRFSERIALAVQTDIKYSASDYLDDVSKLYRTTYNNPNQAYVARPGYNVVDPITRVRGDNNAMNDFYFNNRLVLHIGLGSGKKKQETFVAPVIYTLAAPYRSRKAAVDSTRIKQVADSLQKLRNDSVYRSRIDSVKILQDSILQQNQRMQTGDSAMRLQLENINAELKQLRTSLQNQKVEPRRQQLQQQTDSLNAIKKRIGEQKRISEEDRLRLRIYDFQLDSLNRESQKLSLDSASKVSNTSAQKQATVAQPARDPEVQAYLEEIEKLKKDKRYKEDQAFRRNVDSLNYRFEQYRPAPAVATSAKEKARIDSLQARIDYLESSSRRQAMPVVRDTAAVVKQPVKEMRRDTILSTPIRSVATDTVQVRKKWYQRLFSTGKEKKDTVLTVETRELPDTTTTKKKWYQKLFSTGKQQKDTVITIETRDRPDTTTKKKNWFQRVFSTGPKEETTSSNEQRNKREDENTATDRRERRTNAVTEDRNSTRAAEDNNRSTARENSNTDQRTTTTRNTVVVPAATDTTRRSTTSNRRNQRETVVTPATVNRVEPASAKDTVELNNLIRETELARVRNEQAITSLQSQLKRSSDSAAFYRNALVQNARVEEEVEPATKRRGIFNNRRKEEEEARQREAEQQAIRDRYLEQQRYQADQVAQLQRRIEDLQYNNRSISRYQDDYSTEIRRRNLYDGLSTSAVVLDNTRRSNVSATDSREILSMREELDRLKAQVNDQDVKLRVADSLAKRDSATTGSIVPDTLSSVTAMVDTPDVADSSALTDLRSEITTLREELDRIKSTPAPTQPVTSAEPDLSSFPVVSVYFSSGSTQVASGQITKLNPFAQAALKSKRASILLRGFADATGNAAANKLVVQKRIDAVKNLLVTKYKLSLYQISTDEPQIATGRGRANPLDRRVDLSFQ